MFAPHRSVILCLIDHLLFLILYHFSLGMTQGDSVHQFPSYHVSEQEKITLYCRYETLSTPNLFWYIQDGNKAPQFMMSNYLNEDARFKDRFSAHHDSNKKFFNLTLSAAVLSDSATYFCAMRPTLCQPVHLLTQKNPCTRL
ncbi:TVA84 protein, partial [Amia calva]|nr:TVA84 protein [Amia calva]